MFTKKEHLAAAHRRSDTNKSNRRRCLPGVVTLEERGLLSAAGAALAPAAVSLHAPILNQSPLAAEVHPVTNRVARGERAEVVAARGFRTIHYPGGSVTINRTGTHVIFPGGSVHVNRHGTIVTFPGGFVVAGFGVVVVSFPGGSITV
jgi:hypothetical protein